jgi:hypothetical protein
MIVKTNVKVGQKILEEIKGMTAIDQIITLSGLIGFIICECSDNEQHRKDWFDITNDYIKKVVGKYDEVKDDEIH